jgi:hypothetical protein
MSAEQTVGILFRGVISAAAAGSVATALISCIVEFVILVSSLGTLLFSFVAST